MSTPELRKKLKSFSKAFDEAIKERKWIFPPFPEECKDMICGAKTRAGTPCKLTGIYGNGRCKFHGGLSTGPKTPEGKKRSSMNGFKPKKKANPMKT